MFDTKLSLTLTPLGLDALAPLFLEDVVPLTKLSGSVTLGREDFFPESVSTTRLSVKHGCPQYGGESFVDFDFEREDSLTKLSAMVRADAGESSALFTGESSSDDVFLT